MSEQSTPPARPAGRVPEPATSRPTAAKPAATIYDIARLAGVSASTVSRALNKPGRINAGTEHRIREAAAALDYRSNPMARALPTGRTGALGLIVADITNPVFFTLVRGAERAAATQDCVLLLAESQESGDREADTAARLIPAVDGLILVASRLEDEQILDLATRKPLVVVNREVPGVAGVVSDVGPGIRQALDHLRGLGHTALAFLSGPASSWMSRTRWECLLDEAPRRGLTIVEIGPGDPTREGGRAGLRRVLAAGVTAVLAYNDLMAIGLLDACREAGIGVPQRLSIVGFDDIFGSDFTTPPMTTIRTPMDRIGERAGHRLLAAIGRRLDPAGPVPATELVLRGSTGTLSG